MDMYSTDFKLIAFQMISCLCFYLNIKLHKSTFKDRLPCPPNVLTADVLKLTCERESRTPRMSFKYCWETMIFPAQSCVYYFFE